MDKMAESIEIKIGDILKGISEANEDLVRNVIKTLLDMGAKIKVNLEDTEVYIGEYKLTLSGELKFKTKLAKEEEG